MSDRPDWLPSLIKLDEYGGNWHQYIDGVYAVFHRDFIASQPRFQGGWVRCRRDPMVDGKEAGFWHCISEGKDEMSRTPDMRRCERVAWVRTTIENGVDSSIDIWVRDDGRQGRRVHIWFNEEYLVVLGERKKQVLATNSLRRFAQTENTRSARKGRNGMRVETTDAARRRRRNSFHAWWMSYRNYRPWRGQKQEVFGKTL